jgi:hypothetical protein
MPSEFEFAEERRRKRTDSFDTVTSPPKIKIVEILSEQEYAHTHSEACTHLRIRHHDHFDYLDNTWLHNQKVSGFALRINRVY